MPNPLVSVACADAFTDAATLKDVFNSNGGAFQVTGQPVFYKAQYGGQGVDAWTDEQQLGVGGGEIPPGVTGVAFRNATAGQTATVSAFIVPKGQPKLSLAFPGTVSSSQVAGIIPAAGTIPTAGKGFTYTHVNGSGVYVFTFSTPFAAAPVVIAQDTTIGFAQVKSVTANGFTVQTVNSGTNTLADDAFSFLATAPS